MLKFKKDFNVVRIISLVIAVLFFFNNAVYGIDLPKKFHLRLPLSTSNKEGLERLKELTYHEYVNKYIKSQAEAKYQTFLDENDLEDNIENLQKFYNSLPKYPDTDIAIMEIDSLYKNTRILEHIGLGRFYGKPIIYIDASLEPDEKEIVEGHGYDEITGWIKEKDKRGIEEWGKMRDFIIANYDNLGYERIRVNIHNEANRNHNVDPILEKYKADHTSDLLDMIASMPFKEGDVVIAAMLTTDEIIHDVQSILGDEEIEGIFPNRPVFLIGSAAAGTGDDVDLIGENLLVGLVAVKLAGLFSLSQKEVSIHPLAIEEFLREASLDEVVQFIFNRHRIVYRITSSEYQKYTDIQELKKVLERDYDIDFGAAGSPNKVFKHLSDGKSRTKQEIAKTLDLSVSTIEPDIYFLRDCGLLDIGKKDRENRYAIKPELISDKTLIGVIQKILDKEFQYGMITENLRNPKNRERIAAEIKILIKMPKGRPVTIDKVVEKLGVDGRTARNALESLVRNGILIERGKGVYFWSISGGSGEDILHENRKDQADKLVTDGEAARRQGQYNTAIKAWEAAISIYNEIDEFQLAQIVQIMLDRLETEIASKYGAGGSVLNVFDKITQDKNINNTFTEKRIAKLVGKAPATVSHDIRALLTLGLLEPIEKGNKIYRVPEQVKSHIASIRPHLIKFRGKLLRPNEQELQQTKDEIDKILGMASVERLAQSTEPFILLPDGKTPPREVDFTFMDWDGTIAYTGASIDGLLVDIWKEMVHKSSSELDKDKAFIQKGIEVIDSTKGDSILPRMVKLALLIYPEIAEYAQYDEKTWYWLNIFMRTLEEKLVEFLSDGEDHLVPGARKLFELFKRSDRDRIPIIVTAGWMDLIYKQIKAVGFGDVVSTVVTGGITVPGDPSFHFKDKTEAIVRCLMQRLSKDRGDSNKIVVMIGDSPQDIIAAKKAAEELGYYIYSVGISKDSKRRAKLIEAGADVLITDYESAFDPLLQWLRVEDTCGALKNMRSQI